MGICGREVSEVPATVRVRVKPTRRGKKEIYEVWVEIPERWERLGTFQTRERALQVARREVGYWESLGHPAVCEGVVR